MSLQVAGIQGVAGRDLARFWLPESGRAGGRRVSCVSVVCDAAEAADCRAGELVVAAPGGEACRIVEILELLVARRAATVLLPASALAPADLGSARRLAARGEAPLGLLADGADPRLLANRLSRAAGSSETELALAAAAHGVDSLQALADTLGRLIGNSVTIESPQHWLLAFSATHGPVDRVREETILRRQGSERVLAWVAREGHLAEILRVERPISIPGNPEFGYNGRVAMRVVADDEVLAIIWATDSARPLDEGDYDTIAQAAEAAAAILLRQRAAALREAEMATELLEDVVHGRVVGVDNIRRLARDLGWDIDRPRHLLVVSIDDLEASRLRHAGAGVRRLQRTRERLNELVRLEVAAVDPMAVIGPRASGAIVLLATDHQDEGARQAAALRLAERIARRVDAALPDVTVTVGVGHDYAAITGIPDAYRQAELAVRLGGALWGGNRAVRYSDLGVHRVLFAMREHEDIVTPALQRLVDHDARHHSDYVRTLDAYLACMGRLRATAERLGIHRNTLEYRMGRIQEVAGESLDDPNNRLALELGIRLLELRRRTGPAHSSP